MRFKSVISLPLLPGLAALYGASASSNGDQQLLTLSFVEDDNNIYRRKRSSARTKDKDIKAYQYTDGLMQITPPAEARGVRPRIVGGTPAEPGEYPFFVHVANDELCGGTLIYPDIVLTAAHCQNVWIGNAIIGSTNIVGGDDAEQIEIEEIRPHPDYIGLDVAGIELNDVMIVKLARASATGQLIALNTNANLPVDDETVTVIGFGLTSDGGEVSLELLEVDVTNYNFDVCIDNLGDIGLVPEEQICAGELAGGKDSCSGDSGGPLLDLSNSIQYGIVSFGIGCAEENTPAIYSRVSFYVDFIQQAICEMSANPPPVCSPPTPNPTLPPSPLTPPTLPPTRMAGPLPTPIPTRPPTAINTKGNGKGKGRGKWQWRGKGRGKGKGKGKGRSKSAGWSKSQSKGKGKGGSGGRWRRHADGIQHVQHQYGMTKELLSDYRDGVF